MKDVPPLATPLADREWVKLTVKLATSWVGLSTAYVVALIALIPKFKELSKALQDIGVPPPLAPILIPGPIVLAFIFSTVPKIIEHRRTKRYGQISGALLPGYFTLRPREDGEDFDRADDAHRKILEWIQATNERVLYLTGASGTGKSSLIAAWAVPRLSRAGHVVLVLRGYENIPARIQEELLKPGVIWEKPPTKKPDLQALIQRSIERLNQAAERRRLIIVLDQFEEFLILNDEGERQALQQLLVGPGLGSPTFILVFRHDYQGILQSQAWPKVLLDVNLKEVFAFSENAAQQFIKKSGLQVNADLLRSVLREAAEIEGTSGLIRPITINLCGLVLGRFSGGVPRKFRRGLIRGFLRESLTLPEVRDTARKLIPQLVTSNVNRQPRTVSDLARATSETPEVVRACLRRLGQSDRAILRYVDQQQETWEISHDFLVPVLDSIVARRTVSAWRVIRPWFPWVAAALTTLYLVIALRSPDPVRALADAGWIVETNENLWHLTLNNKYKDPSQQSIKALDLVMATELDLTGTQLSAAMLQELVKELGRLKNLTALKLNNLPVDDISALSGLKKLTTLDLSNTGVSDLTALKGLNLSNLNLSNSRVSDLTELRGLKLFDLNLGNTPVSDVSALSELKSLGSLNLSGTSVSDVSALSELNSLGLLNLSGTSVSDISALKDLRNLMFLNLNGTRIREVSAVAAFMRLDMLELRGTEVRDISGLKGLTGLTELRLGKTYVSDISALEGLRRLTDLELNKRLPGSSLKVSDSRPS